MMTHASLSSAAAACIAAVVLSGCAGGDGALVALDGVDATRAPSNAGLDAYVAASRRNVKAAFGSFNGAYSEVRIEPVYPNEIEFVFVYSEFFDVSDRVGYLDRMRPILRKTFATQVAPEMEELGIAHPKVTWTYVKPDESLIWTHTFTKS